MAKFLVRGGAALYGNVTVSGSKNAALPVLFASVCMEGGAQIRNLPDIGDVRSSLSILKSFGIDIKREGEITYINTENKKYSSECSGLACHLRASTYLIGACLSAFGRAELMDFGGCNFALRPIDIHLDAARAFGAQSEGSMLFTKELRPANFTLRKSSVGATVNALILASSAKGKSTIIGAAEEPHIDTLIEFLSSAGAEITKENGVITVIGGNLSYGRITIPGDMIEAGSFLAASLVTGGCVRVHGASVTELNAFLSALDAGGTEICVEENAISAIGLPKRPFHITTAPYPGFPTDLQPIIAAVMGAGAGGSIEEKVWEGRFGYLDKLRLQGLSSRVIGNRAELFASEYVPASVVSGDLRGGAASLIAALGADGRSEIDRAELIMRGYQMPHEKLLRLGADVELIG